MEYSSETLTGQLLETGLPISKVHRVVNLPVTHQLLQLGVPISKVYRYANYPLTDQLFQQGLPIAKVYRIIKSRKPARNLILHGLDWKTVKCLTHRKDTRACAFKGTPHARKVLDLRHHHLTQNKDSSKYAGMDAISAAQSAAYRLCKRRHEFIKSGITRKVDPPPGLTTNSQITKLRQQNETRLSQSSYEVIKDKPAKQYEEMERHYNKICELEDSVAQTDSSNSNINIESNKVAQSESKEPETHRKRKREALSSSESPAVGLPGDADHDWKRRKLEIGTTRPKIPPSSLQKEWRIDDGEMVRPSRSPADSGTDVELASSDQEASKETHLTPSNFPGNSGTGVELDSTDRGAPKEAISTINTPQPSVKAEEKEDSFVSFERTARISERSAVNKSMMRSHGREFKKHGKPIGPSKEFRSFFETRRQRKALLLKGESLWDEEDASFMQSGKKFAEPGTSLGAEVVAKRLLAGDNSKLTKLMKKSQNSKDERRRHDSSRPSPPEKKVSRRQQRLKATISKSGLHLNRA